MHLNYNPESEKSRHGRKPMLRDELGLDRFHVIRYDTKS